MKENASTIVALATPMQKSAVAIVRVSGPLVIELISKLTGETLQPRVAKLANIYSNNNRIIDKALVIYFKAPNSFTGEDLLEIQCHGSLVIIDEIIKSCLAFGCVNALPGEFSKRAFLNDKIDLTQAEAIASLIDAKTKSQADSALKSLQGEFSKLINNFSESLIDLRMYVEASLDFSDEDIEFINDGKILQKTKLIEEELEKIISISNTGVILSEGVKLVIAGPANAGKSSLLNTFLQTDRAIVTDIAGTTRDVIKEQFNLDGIPVEIVDTAGLRVTDDIVESKGIEKTKQEINLADLVLYVHDISVENDIEKLVKNKTQEYQDKKIIFVINKIDLVDGKPKSNIIDNKKVVFVCVKNNSGIDLLKQTIKQEIGYEASDSIILARRRHVNIIMQAKEFIKAAIANLKAANNLDLIAEDLKSAHNALGEITGKFSTDDILGKIFSSFCIGK